MASTHKLLLFSKVFSNLVVLIDGVDLMVVSVHLNLNLIIMYKSMKAFFSTTAIHHILQSIWVLKRSRKCAIKTFKTFGLTTGVLLDCSRHDKMMTKTVLLITTYLLL